MSPRAIPRWKHMPMSQVKYISSSGDIPVGEKYVLVEYGDEGGQTKHARGFTITVARNHPTSDLSFLANVHSAKGLAKREGISAVFACKV
jgi:hypothetical protein